jgi:RimJ/RimL family protein N-acetyltransferase
MISFAPLQPDAIALLQAETGISFADETFLEPKWFCATSRDAQGEVDGVFVGEFTSWFDVNITTVVIHPRFMSRRLLRAIFTALFSRAVRVTAFAEPENEKSIRGLERMGFVREGFCRFIIDGRRDGFVYGMVVPECKWLRQPQQVFEEAAQ